MLSAIVAPPQRVLARFVFALALLASFVSVAVPAQSRACPADVGRYRRHRRGRR